MNVRSLFVALVVTATSFSASAQVLYLVTDAEAKASQAAGGLLAARSAPPVAGAPRIDFIVPDLAQPVSTPTKIDVRFTSTPPSEPLPDSFKAYYGAFRLDITKRLIGAAKVTKEGITVPQAVLPAGRHQLLLTITDTMGRESQRVVSFTVQ